MGKPTFKARTNGSRKINILFASVSRGKQAVFQAGENNAPSTFNLHCQGDWTFAEETSVFDQDVFMYISKNIMILLEYLVLIED